MSEKVYKLWVAIPFGDAFPILKKVKIQFLLMNLKQTDERTKYPFPNFFFL